MSIIKFLPADKLSKNTITVGELNNKLIDSHKEFICLKIIDVDERIGKGELKANLTILVKSGLETYYLKIPDKVSLEQRKPKYYDIYHIFGRSYIWKAHLCQ